LGRIRAVGSAAASPPSKLGAVGVWVPSLWAGLFIAFSVMMLKCFDVDLSPNGAVFLAVVSPKKWRRAGGQAAARQLH